MDSFLGHESIYIFLRLAIAALVGGAIGLNRELHGKDAGLRTHALVTLGAATTTLAALRIGGVEMGNLSRVIQGIITGIGFLGAGVIVHNQANLHITGLTTAATIWVAASLGIICAIGDWQLVAISIFWIFIILVLGPPLENFVMKIRNNKNEPENK